MLMIECGRDGKFDIPPGATPVTVTVGYTKGLMQGPEATVLWCFLPDEPPPQP